MIKKIVLIQIFIVSTFGQIVQNDSLVSENLSAVGFNQENSTEIKNAQTNEQNQNLVVGQQLVVTNGSKLENENINNGNSSELSPTSTLKQKSVLTTLRVLVNMSSTVVTQPSVFDVVNADQAKTLSSNGKKSANLTKDHSIKNEKTKSAISEFPADFMSDEIRNNGGFIVHILILTYCCLALAVVCDAYFLKSLELISSALRLPPDIAGATFMAIGTSAPELFTSVIGVFISDNDIGTGTIVGSAVFNLIVIPGACGFAAYYNLKEMPKITSFPIIRDTIFYILTIITLILCIKDNKVDWVESLTLLALYGVYIVIMFFNAQYSHLIIENNNEEVNEKTPLLKNGKSSIEDESAYLEDYSKIELTKAENGKYVEIRNKKTEPHLDDRKHHHDDDDDEDDDWTNNCFMVYLLLPMTILFKVTLPKPTKFCFVFTFLMSIVWIALLTYVTVWMVTVVGYSVGIPDTVSGITILAAGTSIPELISSYIIVKKAGLADMAICNSIGSNIFDILFCLGVPWLLKSLVLFITQGIGFSTLANTSIPIQSSALPVTSFTLLLTIVAMIATFKFTKWRLGLSLAIVCSIVYIVFVVVSTFLEINV